MPTGDSYVNLALKRFLSQNRMSANLLDYNVAMTRDGISRSFPSAGIFTFPVTITQDGAAGDFDLSPDPIEAIDDQGRVLILEGASRCQNIPYANVASENYWLALKYIEGPDGVYPNPRTGVPEYDKWKEEVGERDVPNLVVDTGAGTMTVTVDNLFPDGGDHSGRMVTIWLVNPMSVDAAVAIEEIAVIYAAGANKITTTGDLGQSTISTNNADYQVACYGVSIYNNGLASANPYSSEYAVIGYIVGGNPGSNDVSDELDLSGGLYTLQTGYDGAAGSGAGRTITVLDEAVQLIQGSSASFSEDINDSALRIRKDITTSLPGSGYEDEKGIDISQRFYSLGAFNSRIGLADFTGSVTPKLILAEAVTLVATGAGDTIDFTRISPAGLDLNLSGYYGEINARATGDGDQVEISGSALGQDGVYGIATIPTSTSLTVVNADGTSPSFSAEIALTARIYRPLLSLGGFPNNVIRIQTANDFYRDDKSLVVGTHHPTLYIDAPDNSDDTDVLFRIKRDTSSYIDMYAAGSIILSDHLTSTTGNIEATAGTVTGGTGVTATTGNVNATAGNINAVAGSINAVVGPVTAGTTVTAGTDVRANVDIIADFNGDGSGDFKYGADKSITTWILPNEFATGSDWDMEPGATGAQQSIVSINNGEVTAVGIKLPDGVTLNEVRVLTKPDATSTITVGIYRTENTWAHPEAVGNRTLAGAPPSSTVTSTGASGVVETVTVTSLGEVIDNTLYQYEIHITSNIVSGNNNVYGAQIDYDLSTVNFC